MIILKPSHLCQKEIEKKKTKRCGPSPLMTRGEDHCRWERRERRGVKMVSSSTNKGTVFLVTNTAPLGMDLLALLTLDERCLIAVGFFARAERDSQVRCRLGHWSSAQDAITKKKGRWVGGCVWALYVVTFLNWTSMLEWRCVARRLVKIGRWKIYV